MISILIPCYNDDPSVLITELKRLCQVSKQFNEIIVYDDASTKAVTQTNDEVTIVHGKENIGDFAARKKLAHLAKNDWLLYLDADVEIINDDFLDKYYNSIIRQNEFVVYGGVNYQKNAPDPSKMLRWLYGKKREEKNYIPYELRYENFVAASFLVSKNLFLKACESEPQNIYGTDLLLAAYFKKHKSPIQFTFNPVLHNGLEDNKVFINKAMEAVKATYLMETEGLIENDHKPLQRLYLKLKNKRLHKIVQQTILILKPLLLKNLTSKKPKLSYLDLLKLEHFIALKNA